MAYKNRRKVEHQIWVAAQRGDCAALDEILSYRKRIQSARWFQKALDRGLRVAAINDHAHAMRLLLSAGAGVKRTSHLLSPLVILSAQYCMSPGADALRLLLDAKADIERDCALHLASKVGNIRAVRELLLAKANVHSRRLDSATPLQLTRCPIVARLLVAANASVNNITSAPGIISLYPPPLLEAVEFNRHDLVRVLLRAHADVQPFDEMAGNTLLYCQHMQRWGRGELMKLWAANILLTFRPTCDRRMTALLADARMTALLEAARKTALARRRSQDGAARGLAAGRPPP